MLRQSLGCVGVPTGSPNVVLLDIRKELVAPPCKLNFAALRIGSSIDGLIKGWAIAWLPL